MVRRHPHSLPFVNEKRKRAMPIGQREKIMRSACCNQCLRAQLKGEKYPEGHYRCNELSHEQLEILKNSAAYVSFENGRWIIVQEYNPTPFWVDIDVNDIDVNEAASIVGVECDTLATTIAPIMMQAGDAWRENYDSPWIFRKVGLQAWKKFINVRTKKIDADAWEQNRPYTLKDFEFWYMSDTAIFS